MTCAIIQARMGSTRLPGKVLLPLSGKTVLEHVVERVAAAKKIDNIVVATTTLPEDDAIVDLCARNKIIVFRGSADDVLERYYEAAKKVEADIIVRITADDPLKEPEIIDQLVALLYREQCDYASNTIHPTFPEGMDVEAFAFSALARAHKEALLKSEREHVTPYIWKHAEMFNIRELISPNDYSFYRCTLDCPDDYEFIKTIYKELYTPQKIFHMKQIIDLLKREPQLCKINNKHRRNEGYLKSVWEETKNAEN